MGALLGWVRRHGLRAAAVVVCALLALGLAPEGWRAAGAAALPRLSPILNLFGALAARQVVGWSVLLGVPLLVVAFFWGRVFCWRVCPMGFLAELAGRLNPWGRTWLRKVPALNKALALVICVTAACGYPLLIWLDPLCIFNGFFAAWRGPLTLASASIGALFALVLALAATIPNVWCHKVCPLGGVQQIVMEFARWLKSPKGGEAPKGLVAGEVSRRAALAAVPAVVAGVTARRVFGPRGAQALRPPSADVARINALCARCGNCMRACPYGLIHPDLGETGIDGLLSPVIHFRSKIPNWDPDEDRYCFQDCVACTQVCPTGALRPITVEEKHRLPIGRAVVLKEKCLAWAKGEYCAVCDEYCPYKAIKLEKRGEVNCPVVDPDLCRGCGACEGACPGDPVAIVVRPLPL
ncbi:MAG: 4Fe-4S dicluster domain-containing protein [Kiritimatiellia bacterium]